MAKNNHKAISMVDPAAYQQMEVLLQQTVMELSAYKYALDVSSIVSVTDEKGTILHVNDNFCKISKYTREELIGQDHRIINSSYHLKPFINDLWTTIANGNIWKGELKNKAKDGSYYWVDTTIVPFLNEAGKPYQYIAIRSDITQQKHEEHRSKLLDAVITDSKDAAIITKDFPVDLPEPVKRALSKAITKSLEERNTILESIGDAFFAVDKNWIVTYWNRSAEQVLSKKKAEVMNLNLWDVFSTEVGSVSYQQYHVAIDTNKSVHFEDHYAILNKWYEISAYPTGNGLSVYFKDITARKLADLHLKHLNMNLQKQARALAVSNTELEQFAYVASHDLQEPLRMVTSFLTQIEKKYGTVLDAKGKQYIHFAVDGARRMRQIILDLLEFSRVGCIDEPYEEVDLKNIVDDILALYRKQIAEQKAIFTIGDLPVLQTLKVPLRQVFQNLISNSLKYQAKGVSPLITISCTGHEKYWLFRISDNGIGIDPVYFDKIFVIFQRLHNRDEYSGTGMGLAVTKKIIENLGGKIYLESDIGKGTTFYFTLLKR